MKQQVFTDWHWLVIDDASASNYARKLAEEDERVTVICNRTSLGKSGARNKALSKAKGYWIGFLDDDDVFLPNHLLTVYNAIRKNGAKKAIYRTKYLTKRSATSAPVSPIGPIKSQDPWIQCLFNNTNIFPWVAPAEYAQAIEFPDFKLFQDAHYFLQLGLALPIHMIDEVTATYNLYGVSGSAQTLSKEKAINAHQEELKALKSLFNLNHPKIKTYKAQGILNLALAMRELYDALAYDTLSARIAIPKAISHSSQWPVLLTAMKLVFARVKKYLF